LEWDPAYLNLLGILDDADSPYSWLLNYFPDDRAIDRLNNDRGINQFWSEQVCTEDSQCAPWVGCDLGVPCTIDGDCRPETYCDENLSCGSSSCCHDSFCFFTGFPFNDGSCYYVAASQLFNPPGPAYAQPGPGGLLVIKFRFQVTAPPPDGQTQVRLLHQCSPNTFTRVFSGETPIQPLCCEGPEIFPPQGTILDPPATIHVETELLPAPPVVAEGSRYIRVTPAPGATLVALRVKGLSADVFCVSKYVRADGTLGTASVSQSGTSWGTVHVHDVDIRPGTTYEVRALCGGAPSPPAVVTTWEWGDVNKDFLVDVDDLVGLVQCIGGFYDLAAFESCDLLPCDPIPGLEAIDIDDILALVDAYGGSPYSAFCGPVCP
jgi:hypothetical protein